MSMAGSATPRGWSYGRTCGVLFRTLGVGSRTPVDNVAWRDEVPISGLGSCGDDDQLAWAGTGADRNSGSGTIPAVIWAIA